MFGENFGLDPVSRMLGICLLLFSGGQINVDVQMFSQAHFHSASIDPCLELLHVDASHPEICACSI